jgi:hypothetical protein
LGGAHRRAVRHLRRAIALGDKLTMPYELARAHLELGRRLPNRAEARQHTEQAISVFEAYGCTSELAAARDTRAASEPVR